MQLKHAENIIQIKDLSYSYGNNKVLDNINLNIHKGDYIGIVGPNGGGKSTLVKLILGLLEKQSGQIITSCKNFAYVAQKATDTVEQKFPITVAEVVAMGADKKSSEEAIKKIGIENIQKKLIGDLSGGQMQKVFIAHALAQNPQVLFLDEPTSGIDQQSQDEFYRLLKKLNQQMGITLVTISHDVDIITKEATEIVAINRKLVFYGEAKNFIKEEKGIKYIHHD